MLRLRRVSILFVLVGCASVTPGPAAPAEQSDAPPEARVDAGARGDEDDAEGLERGAPSSSAEPASEPTPVDAGSGEPAASGEAAPPDAMASAEPGPDPSPASDPDPAPKPLAIAADQVPRFARLDFAPRKLGKPRARIRRAGALYAPASLAPLTDAGDRHWLALEVRVLDADATGDPRRPRVLCENEASRIGVAVDAQDLSTTVRARAFVGPRPTPPERVTSKTPGLRLAGGTEVEVRGASADGATAITHRGLFLVAEGFVASNALDVVYTPVELEDDGRRNGELLRNVRFLDAPDGVEIARTERDDGVANVMHVLRLGPVEDGHVLVRYQESEAFVVGWVPEGDVKAFETTRLRWGRGSGSGFGSRAKVAVELARGTRLVPTNSEEVIGVVTKTHVLPCAFDCTGPNPHVRIRACARELTLRAVP